MVKVTGESGPSIKSILLYCTFFLVQWNWQRWIWIFLVYIHMQIIFVRSTINFFFYFFFLYVNIFSWRNKEKFIWITLLPIITHMQLTHLCKVDSSTLTFWNDSFPTEGVCGFFLVLPCFIEIPVFNSEYTTIRHHVLCVWSGSTLFANVCFIWH